MSTHQRWHVYLLMNFWMNLRILTMKFNRRNLFRVSSLHQPWSLCLCLTTASILFNGTWTQTLQRSFPSRSLSDTWFVYHGSLNMSLINLFVDKQMQQDSKIQSKGLQNILYRWGKWWYIRGKWWWIQRTYQSHY